MATVGDYDCIATRVRARRASPGEVVECSGIGRVLTGPGEWVVEVPEAGSRLVMTEKTFEALFQPTEPCDTT
jgi:hypothetical protein